MSSKPTQRTVKALKDAGFTVAIVEKWNPFAKIRQDLFGFIDILAISPGCIFGIQTTSGSNASARVQKALGLPTLREWLMAGGLFQVWSWSKKGPRGKRKVWTIRKTSLFLADGEIRTREIVT